MGRGRAKAKQTKVARELKYRTMDTDFGSLERELHGSAAVEHRQPVEPDPYDDVADKYATGEDDESPYRRLG